MNTMAITAVFMQKSAVLVYGVLVYKGQGILELSYTVRFRIRGSNKKSDPGICTSIEGRLLKFKRIAILFFELRIGGTTEKMMIFPFESYP